jgi:hypothetical protein
LVMASWVPRAASDSFSATTSSRTPSVLDMGPAVLSPRRSVHVCQAPAAGQEQQHGQTGQQRSAETGWKGWQYPTEQAQAGPDAGGNAIS